MAYNMGIYSHFQQNFEQLRDNKDLWRERMVAWRREPVSLRLDHPTRLDRARALGYTAKQGVFVVRQRVLRGGHKRPDIKGGRMPKNSRQRMELRKNYQLIAEERANIVFPNCEVLNSYELAKDGRHYWFEVIMVDPQHPVVRSDSQLAGFASGKHRGRVFRGLSGAGRRMRGLLWKGEGVEKARPSRRSHDRRL